MGQLTFDVARARAAELHDRVNNNDPANSAIKLVVLAETGLVSDDVLRGYATLADLLAGASNEVTNTGYVRITLADADIVAAAIDYTEHSVTLNHSTVSFGSPNVAAGDSWRKIVYCYDSDTTGGTDANIIPITAHDMLLSGAAIIPSAAPVLWSVPNGYYVSRV